MLMMVRREGETILIGDDIEVVITHIGRSRVKVGIRAPREMPVMAREVKLVGDENRAASARSDAALSKLLKRFGPPVQVPLSPAEKGK
jgi:carbon storage regulator